MRRYWYHVDRFDASAFRERRILENVEALTFRFLAINGEWHNTWPPENVVDEDFSEMPTAVEATLEVEGASGTINRLFVLPH